jgi:hypothetical protein
VIKKLIRCTACNQVIPNYGGYELAQAMSLPGVEWSNADLVSAKEFLRTHFGHPLEELMVEGDTSISERPSYESVRVTYFLAGNVQRKFLIRRTKSALDEPASYEIIPGKLKISNLSLEVQEDHLRKQVNAEKGFSLPLKRKMARFIQAIRDEIADISPTEFEGMAEKIEDGETSLSAYGSIKESFWARILDRCRRDFDEFELEAIRRFIDEHRHPPDVLSIQIQRSISVIALVKADSASLAPEERKDIEAATEAQSSAITERKVAERKLGHLILPPVKRKI